VPLAIRSIGVHLVRLRTAEGLKTSIHDVITEQEYVLTRLKLSDGSEGFGEAPEATFITGETASSMIEAIERHLAPAVVGRDPFDLAGAHLAMDRALAAGNSAAKSAVDLAIYDALGKHLGQPVSRVLGGAPRGPIASSKAIGTGPLKEMVASARRQIAAGFGTVKIKTGADSTAELAAVKAIRAAGGPGLNIKLDANQGWTLPEALRFLDRARQFDIQMVEQPLAAADLKGHAELRRRIAIPVMLDESIHGPGDALRAIEAGACDYINIKLLKAGGLFPAQEVATVCAAGGVACQIGSLSTSIGTAAAIHLVHARPIMKFAEVNWPARLASDVGTGFSLVKGRADVAPTPGLGIKVDTRLLRGGRS